MYMRSGRPYRLKFKKEMMSALTDIMPDKSPAYRNLNVHILHRLIIKHILGLTPAEGEIIYTRDADEAVGLVKKNKAGLAFILSPLSADEVREAALSGEKMPQKSTYFYPKIPTGLVINKL